MSEDKRATFRRGNERIAELLADPDTAARVETIRGEMAQAVDERTRALANLFDHRINILGQLVDHRGAQLTETLEGRTEALTALLDQRIGALQGVLPAVRRPVGRRRLPHPTFRSRSRRSNCPVSHRSALLPLPESS